MPTTTVPDLISLSAARPDTNPMTEEETESLLAAASLGVARVRKVMEPRRHLGVISMIPAPGTTVPEWHLISITINEDPSLGFTPAPMTPPPPPRPTVIPTGAFMMPKLKELTIRQANKALPVDGQIDEGNIRHAYSDTVAEGLIISSEPPAGGLAWLNDPRYPVVTVSLGKRPGNWFRKHL